MSTTRPFLQRVRLRRISRKGGNSGAGGQKDRRTGPPPLKWSAPKVRKAEGRDWQTCPQPEEFPSKSMQVGVVAELSR
jgi:hypothetical protein